MKVKLSIFGHQKFYLLHRIPSIQLDKKTACLSRDPAAPKDPCLVLKKGEEKLVKHTCTVQRLMKQPSIK